MSFRPPSRTSHATVQEAFFDALGHEVLAEKAASLGRAGERMERALSALAGLDREVPERSAAIRASADAVYAYFIQRELCGFRRHEDIIRDYKIPREVLVRLGAK